MKLCVASIFRAGFATLVVAGFVVSLTLWIRSMSVGDSLRLGRGTAVVEWHGRWARSYRLESYSGRLSLVQDNTHTEGGMGGRAVVAFQEIVGGNFPVGVDDAAARPAALHAGKAGNVAVEFFRQAGELAFQ